MEQLYSPKEAALILGIHEHTLYKWRAAGDGPPYLRFSATGRVRYERESLWAWVQERQSSHA
jgi:predicted site-specific integrase-resolvase